MSHLRHIDLLGCGGSQHPAEAHSSLQRDMCIVDRYLFSNFNVATLYKCPATNLSLTDRMLSLER